MTKNQLINSLQKLKEIQTSAKACHARARTLQVAKNARQRKVGKEMEKSAQGADSIVAVSLGEFLDDIIEHLTDEPEQAAGQRPENRGIDVKGSS